MILVDQNASVMSAGIADEIAFSINKEGLPVILNILRNSLYSNKELAVIRELSCNAFDAMVEAGKGDQPIRVSLPTMLEPALKIRDFGNSLTHEEVRQIFVEYGASTKRNSNAYVGMMGIGAKSPFAYGDSFMVIAYKDGKKRSYSCYLDVSQVGSMALLGEDDTTEPDGLEVIVSVKEEDFNKFIIEARNFFSYWKVRPTIENLDLEIPETKWIFKGADGDWLIPQKNGYSSEPPKAIMGNVPYALDNTNLDWSNQDTQLAELIHLGVRIWFDIGELEVAASRETLQYTDKTQKAIFERLTRVKREIVMTVDNIIANMSSMYEAKLWAAKLDDMTSPYYALRNIFQGQINYKGKPVNSDYWIIDEAKAGASMKVYVKGDGWKKNRAYSSPMGRLYAHPRKLVVINDLELETGILSRVAPLLEWDTQNHLQKQMLCVQFITIRNHTDWEAFKTEKDIDCPMTLLSDLPKVKLSLVYPPDQHAKSINPKHLAEAFHLVDDSVHVSGRRGRKSDYWETCEVDLDEDEGVYVWLQKFEYKNQRGWYERASSLRSLKYEVKAAGIAWPDNFIGIKESKVEKAPENMVCLWDYLREEITKKLHDSKLIQIAADVHAAEEFNDAHSVAPLLRLADELPLPSNDELLTLKKHYNFMRHESSNKEVNSLRSLAGQLNLPTNIEGTLPSWDLEHDLVQAQAKYPLLFNIDAGIAHHNYPSWKTGLEQYVGLVNNCMQKSINEVSMSEGEGI